MGLALVQGPGEALHVVAEGPERRLSAAMGLLNVATAELVASIAEALESGGWQGDGIVTIEQWVALRCGVTASRSRRLVCAARALVDLPAASAAFGEGALSEDQVGVICRHVDGAHDAEVTELARRCTVGQLRRILPSVVPPDPAPDPLPDGEPIGGEEGDADSTGGDTPGRREVSFGNAEDGRWWARMLLPPDEGALVQLAIEASLAALVAAEPAGSSPERGHGPLAPRLGWSDAVLHMAEVALANIEGTGRPPSDRYQVILHVDADDAERARLHLGPLVPASLRDYLSCDASGRVVLERNGTPIHVFARMRTVDDRLRKLIEQRDAGCVVPGCGRRRRLHVHHLRHHEDGGRTVPENLCCLCPAHHRLHHAGKLGIEGDPTRPGGLRFTDRSGRVLRGPAPWLPGAPPHEAAAAMGLPASVWEPPHGERLDTKWITWS
ncbi:MAG TPA: DUF222 domain-containing protein [Acidimicrobiales bacterium]|nr:DUF222 domain-containing protein [Acidimicrobiales bacterium]